MPRATIHREATVAPVHPDTRVIRIPSAWMWTNAGREVNAALEPNALTWQEVDTLAVAPRAL